MALPTTATWAVLPRHHLVVQCSLAEEVAIRASKSKHIYLLIHITGAQGFACAAAALCSSLLI